MNYSPGNNGTLNWVIMKTGNLELRGGIKMYFLSGFFAAIAVMSFSFSLFVVPLVEEVCKEHGYIDWNDEIRLVCVSPGE